jgi:hypothetical protein
MNAMGYLINSVLVLLVLRQVRETRLTLPMLLLPVVAVVGVAAYYLHSIPTAGNDVLLDLTLAAAGAVLGALCALATRMRRGADGAARVKAGWLAALLWVAGIGARMAFAYAAGHGAGPAIARFSISHHITSGNAWVAALVMMALAEVGARLAVMWLRGSRLPAVPAAAASPASVPSPVTA